MSTKIPNDVLNVLERSTTDGPRLILPEQLDPKTYRATNKVLEAAGGKWNRQQKAHVFPGDAAAAIEGALTTGEFVDVKKEFDAFYTPHELANRVIELANIEPGMTVLEPSMGDGALVQPALEAGALVTGIDLRQPMFETLYQEFNFRAGDFMHLTPENLGTFDRVVMNPPFSKQQDIDHVTHALEFVKPGGILVAIMSPSWQFRMNGKSVLFRDLWSVAGGTVEDVPAGAFRVSGTDIRSTIVTFVS